MRLRVFFNAITSSGHSIFFEDYDCESWSVNSALLNITTTKSTCYIPLVNVKSFVEVDDVD